MNKMERNKYKMVAGWEIMGFLDKNSQEIVESLTNVQMLTSEANFKFKKQVCKEKEFTKDLKYTTTIDNLPNGKKCCIIVWENDYIYSELKFIEFRTNHCLI